MYATARAITVLGEVDGVLDSIVSHAHELIGVDIAYLSVFDEAYTELELRAVEGAISSTFRTARVPASTGVAGKVISTRMPFWVSNYLDADNLEHDPTFDDLLSTEGIVALLGVPLRGKDRVIGVLYAADRVERVFSPDEVALLSAFADHAAVALENARLYSQSRSALDELRGAYATIEHQVAMMERSSQVHEALTQVVLTGGGADKVAETLLDALGGRVSILNRADRIAVTRATAVDQSRIVEPDLKVALNASRDTGRSITTTGHDGVRHTVAAILAGSLYLGAVVLTHERILDPVEERTLERCAQIVGLLTLKQEALVDAEERLRGDLLTEVLTRARPIGEELQARGTARGLALSDFDAVLVVDAGQARVLEATRKLHHLSVDWSGLAGQHLGVPTLLMQAEDIELTTRAIHRALRRDIGAPVLVCGAPLDTATPSLGRAFDLARRCSQIAQQVGITDRGITTGQYSLYAILFDPDRGADLDDFLQETLGAVARYDRDRGTDLIATLAAYFDNGGNGARTAKVLHVHINTLLKRLERVTSILGDDWQHPDTALRIRLAVRLHQLADIATV